MVGGDDGGGNPLKSLIAILIGFILATVGLDIITGQLRLTFGFTGLMKGFDFIIAVIGLFGIGEILLSVEEGLTFHGTKTRINPRASFSILGRSCRAFGAPSCAALSLASGWASSPVGPRRHRS